MAGGVAGHFDAIAEFAEHSMWKHGTPGLVVGVTDRNASVFTCAKGTAEMSSGRPMSTDLLFQIGSVSKSFTCIALLQLAEEGVLKLDDPVKKHLPWFNIRTRFRDITLHHLMTHTAGIIMGSDATPTGPTEVRDLRDTEAACEPGTHFHYSNSGYKALGLVLEKVTGQSYAEIIRQRVLERAGMDSTEPVITNDIRDRLAAAHGHVHDDRPSNRRYALYPVPWFEGDTADGSICAPLEDMLAYIRALVNRGAGPRGALLTPGGFASMATPYIEPDDGLHTGGYGHGLNVEDVGGHTYIGHQGGMVGYYTSMLMDMDLGMGVMVMVNGPGEPEEVARFAMEALRNQSEGRPPPAVPGRDQVYEVAEPSGYVGAYADGQACMEVTAQGSGLLLRCAEGEVRLEPREGDSFLADLPGLELFLLEFEKKDGVIDRVHHGSRTYVREGAESSSLPEQDASRRVFEGHYRSHNPWLSNFRVVNRRGGLFFIHPAGKSEPMTPIGDLEFRVGDEKSPERVRFSCIVDGKAMAATLSGGGRFGRTFTP